MAEHSGVQQHHSDPNILDRRTLQDDHRCLAALLSPGLSVLDVGCGTGAITMGIAEAVGPAGLAVGVDRDATLIERARGRCLPPNVQFYVADATALGFQNRFDIVTAARTLQWIAGVDAAIASMRQAAKPGGLIVALDYNHARNSWQPAPPERFAAFYRAFLQWRRSNGWDNEVADRLPERFAQAGLEEIRSEDQTEQSHRGDPDFDVKTALWTGVMDHVAQSVEQAAYCDAGLVRAAREQYEAWRKSGLVRQSLSLKAVWARVPRLKITSR